VKRVGAAAFDRVYANDPDPWQLESSAYERGKYAATLRALGDADRTRTLEIGCAKGAFTVKLARLCESLVAIDFSARAVAAARRRGARDDGVSVLRRVFPEQVPDGPWSLVVCSEVLYYLDPPALDQAMAWFAAALGKGSTLVVVHWRGPGVTEPLRGDDVHDRMVAELHRWHVFDRRSEHYRLDRFGSR
jgi:predicted TPR repeat methyltransferase